MVQITNSQITEFRTVVLDYYQKHARVSMPWRELNLDGTMNPYKILVSEIMLQQTQVSRVRGKYLEFIQLFPSVEVLAGASLSEVLRVWSGLGYNRRAKFLHQAARMIVDTFASTFPRELSELEQLPGVGINTAAAIRVYSFNEPTAFVETNIRTVYLHHFFKNRVGVADTELMPVIEATLDSSSPRQWYWALMDYGSYLKTTLPNPSRRSKHHVVQSNFAGSKRQIRGSVLRLLRDQVLTKAELSGLINDERIDGVLKDLEKERLVTNRSGVFRLG